MSRVCLVACSSSKTEGEAPAKDLYTSDLFKRSRRYAESRFDRWFILSAKHGLLDPEDLIQTYEDTLSDMPRRARYVWSHSVVKDLLEVTTPEDTITFLAGDKYREVLSVVLGSLGYRIYVPLRGMKASEQMSWLDKKLKKGPKPTGRDKDVERLYDSLQRLEEGLGGRRVLGECDGKMDWPKQGIYIFFEPGENRADEEERPRVVGVGIHAVAEGKKGDLWSRLKTHCGNKDGGGNHRTSAFRLRVGAALIARSEGEIDLPSWGVGQSVTRQVKAAEAKHERRVSEYLRKIELLWLDVPGPPGKQSDRAYLERNIIATLAGPDGPLDAPSAEWLGTHSPNEVISESGIWNVEHAGGQYDPRFLEVLDRYVDVTLEEREQPDEPQAPSGWWEGESGIREVGDSGS
jgi:hypothetical protein